MIEAEGRQTLHANDGLCASNKLLDFVSALTQLENFELLLPRVWLATLCVAEIK